MSFSLKYSSSLNHDRTADRSAYKRIVDFGENDNGELEHVFIIYL